jgi:hypothetical protein
MQRLLAATTVVTLSRQSPNSVYPLQHAGGFLDLAFHICDAAFAVGADISLDSVVLELAH